MKKLIKNEINDLIGYVCKANDKYTKWKSNVDNQVVIRKDNFFYKVYKESYTDGYFAAKVRSAFSNVYNELGIYWKIETIIDKENNTIIQIEEREPLKVITELDSLSIDEILENYSSILYKVENLLGFREIEQKLNIDGELKLIRDCVPKYIDYALYNGNVILLDDSDFFITVVKNGNWTGMKFDLIELDDDLFLSDMDIFEYDLDTIITNSNEKIKKLWIFPKQKYNKIFERKLIDIRKQEIENTIKILSKNKKNTVQESKSLFIKLYNLNESFEDKQNNLKKLINFLSIFDFKCKVISFYFPGNINEELKNLDYLINDFLKTLNKECFEKIEFNYILLDEQFYEKIKNTIFNKKISINTYCNTYIMSNKNIIDSIQVMNNLKQKNLMVDFNINAILNDDFLKSFSMYKSNFKYIIRAPYYVNSYYKQLDFENCLSMPISSRHTLHSFAKDFLLKNKINILQNKNCYILNIADLSIYEMQSNKCNHNKEYFNYYDNNHCLCCDLNKYIDYFNTFDSVMYISNKNTMHELLE